MSVGEGTCGKILRGTGRVPFIGRCLMASGWRERGTSMNLGDSGGMTAREQRVVAER